MIISSSDYDESKSIHHGGDAMNQSRDISPCRFLAMIAVLCGAMVLPAYGQQEVNPTWYDPWVPPAPAVVHSSQPVVAIHRQKPTVKPVSSTRLAGKVRAKRSTTRPKSS
jgi:hypothetical protein